MTLRSVIFSVCVTLVSGLVLGGCAKQESSTGEADVVGVYTLTSVDGKDVPATVSHDGNSLQVQSGTFTINADGTCASTTVFVPPAGSEMTREVSATYTRDGAKLTMQWEGAGMTEGTVEGNTFTMDNEGMVFVYTKS